jgi:hydroxyacyl-ACP dehydratase HTD2-like protein with hotdog domain
MTAATPPVSPAVAEPGSMLPELVEHVDIVTNFMFGVALFTAHRLHYDQVGAELDGFTAPVIPGTLMSAYVARLLVDWTGDPTCIRRLTNRNLATEVVGHDIRVSGTVTGVDEVTGDAGEARRRLTCALSVVSDGRVLVESTAVVEVVVATG